MKVCWGDVFQILGNLSLNSEDAKKKNVNLQSTKSAT